ncbi:nuclease PIN [Nocardioides marmoriginsengisoli]|uniref:Nuclease PIN n=1 Tax=Nocardioides marmoriginsengisoli TaxID=661483 RepID=A0A3N0CIB3_9ACTN|nr:nuclease PIN [Nocardioides marmoriginsengisoli]RNL62693.1 nuclease PIN [Nocardioides marmoriginsengisoli]
MSHDVDPRQPWAPHTILQEPMLKFDSTPNPATSGHPLVGLLDHGPYAGPPTDSVRLATITLDGQKQKLYGFLRGATQVHEPGDRRAYVPRYPGFGALFKADLVPQSDAHVDIRSSEIGTGADAHERLSDALARAVRHLHTIRDSWDVIVVLLPEAWEPLRLSSDGALDLHDRLKAMAAPLGCPIQMVREASALRFKYQCSMYWRLSIALLTKSGGVPFRMVQPTQTDTAYLGLAYAIRGGTADEFVTCCSQVFDAEGGGFEFIAYNVGADRDLENPHLTRDEMRTVMARSARLYQRRRAGALPQRLVIHKTTPWREEEVAGVFDAWSPAVADIECLQVRADTPWTGVTLRRGTGSAAVPNSWPVDRGSLQYLSEREALLWVAGTAKGVALQGDNYNQAAKALPTPIAFKRYAGAGPLEIPASEILALSKLDWNNDALYGLTPVTISYSQRLARMISRVPHLPDDSYQFRLFM